LGTAGFSPLLLGESDRPPGLRLVHDPRRSYVAYGASRPSTPELAILSWAMGPPGVGARGDRDVGEEHYGVTDGPSPEPGRQGRCL
jgi:hypothetical protein